MNYAHARRSYQKTAVETASTGVLILMLFDGAIGFLEKALAGFQESDPLEFNRTISNNILRAQAIVHELNVTLNMEDGGEFAETMRRLYNYFDWRLQQSNVKKEQRGVREVLRHTTTLRDVWAEMLRQRESSTAPLAEVNALATGA